MRVLHAVLHEHAWQVPIDTPRLVINRTRVGADESADTLGLGADDAELHFGPTNHRNAEYLGDCDDGVRALAARLGWGEALEAHIRGGRARCDRVAATGLSPH